MHAQFLQYLIDPISKQPLELLAKESNGDCVISGTLRAGANEYPIINGVPRFAGARAENYAKSFGYQWNKWSRVQFDEENIGRPMQGYTTRMWERISGIQGNLNGQLVVDIGCGPGRFVDVARSKGARVIGIDYSQAVEAAAENFRNDPNVCICQADALNPPIKDRCVDGAFSIGVLHHTPNPPAGIEQAARFLKPGGWLAVSVYAKWSYYGLGMVNAYRKLFKLTWPILKHRPPLWYAYFTVYGIRPLTRIPVISRFFSWAFPFVNLPDNRWSVLDTFDSVTPSYQSTHDHYEVFQWLKKNGFENIEPSDWGGISFHGIKRNQP